MIVRIADGFSRVLREWEGETVALIGSGPSLTQEQCNAVRSLNTIAVNNAYLFCPWADIIYAADARWWGWNPQALKLPAYKVSIEQHMKVEFPLDVHVLRNLDKGDPTGLSLDPTGLKTGCNSGYQALNLAVLLGAKRIILLGYDYRFDNGRAHFPGGDHPVPSFENHLVGYAQKFSSIENKLIELGIEVLNATPGTALNAFPKVRLEDFFEIQTLHPVA